MTVDEWIVLGVLAVMVVAQATRRVSPTVGVAGALAALYLAGVLDTPQVLSGFSNPAPATLAALYIVAGAVDRSGGLAPLSQRLLTAGAPRRSLARLTAVSAGLSAVVANTPVVAMFIGPVLQWSRRSGESASQYLIPLSYAAVLGGMPTLIGTSTNLVASGMVAVSIGDGYSLFEPARLGLPVAVVGLLVVLAGARALLPGRGERLEASVARPFTVALGVAAGGRLDGATVTEGGLRQLGAVYLIGVERGGELIAPVAPDLRLRSGDQLTFAGQVDDVVALQRFDGLELVEGNHIDALDDGQHAWFETVVGATSPLVGSTIKEADFRRRYQAAVVAIHRSGEGLDESLGRTRLQVGDSLLLVADADFAVRWRNRGDFLLVQRRSEPPPTAAAAATRSLVILLGMVIATAAGVGVLKAALGAAVATVVTGALTPRQARDSVDINVIVLVAAAIGIGAGVESSGLAQRVADGLVDGASGAGVWGVALGLVVATLLLTELVTNAGAVALMVPVALGVARDVDGDPRIFALGVTVAASASFLTPIGYQTNTMVYGPGRYQFTDYLRLGLPVTAVVVILVPLMMAAGRGVW
ncbi:MAG: SLC13 family permease [Acidimicrobiales bacterium]